MMDVCEATLLGMIATLLVVTAIDFIVYVQMRRSIAHWQNEARRQALECNEWREAAQRWREAASEAEAVVDQWIAGAR